jgi:hypothetical protein
MSSQKTSAQPQAVLLEPSRGSDSSALALVKSVEDTEQKLALVEARLQAATEGMKAAAVANNGAGA